MTEETVSVSKTVWDWMTSWLPKKPADEPVTEPAPVPPAVPEPAAPVVELDKFEALKVERDEFKAQAEANAAKLAEIEAAKVHAEMISGIVAQLQDQGKFGMQFIQVKDAEEAAGVMGSMSPEAREWCMRMFSALAGKINASALYGEIGSNGAGAADPESALDAAIKAKAAEAKTDYGTALHMVAVEKPELFAAVYPKKGGN